MVRKAAIALAILLAGCASGYEQFYQPVPIPAGLVLPAAGPPTVVTSSGDALRDVQGMFTDGYVAVGHASFNGPNQGVAGALAQAKKVGASHVVMAAKYAQTVQGAIPMTLPTTTTSQTSGTVNAFGTGGSATATYSGTTTTQGSQTTYIPYSVDRYDQQAIFFAPLARHGLGMRAFPPTTEQAAARGSNRGLIVDAVRRGSPAHRADILPGDVILEASGKQILEAADFASVLHFGTPLALVIDRHGRTVRVTIDTNEDGNW